MLLKDIIARFNKLAINLSSIQLRIFVILLALVLGSNVSAQSIHVVAKTFSELVPAGYVVVKTVRGDLNKDGRADQVAIIKGTEKSRVVKDASGSEVDGNRRGIVIAFAGKENYEFVLGNMDCFSSEHEYGGVYYPPELLVGVKNGNLVIQYLHGRYGYWSYVFRHKKGGFELIGYDQSENRGPIVLRETSINFLTKKMQVKDIINDDVEPGEETFKTTWSTFSLSDAIKLSTIDDFDGFDVTKKIKLIK